MALCLMLSLVPYPNIPIYSGRIIIRVFQFWIIGGISKFRGELTGESSYNYYDRLYIHLEYEDYSLVIGFFLFVEGK